MFEIQEININQTRGHRLGNSAWFLPFTQDKKKLFKILKKEYGRCISKAYIDLPDETPQEVGWVFEKKMKYEDARSNNPEDFYVREVWVVYREIKNENN